MNTRSQVTTWEPSDAAIAERYGLRAEEILRFDLNTSPWPSPALPEALAGPFDPPLNEYPDSYYADLTDAAAAYTGVEPDEVVVGAGADEVIDLVAKAFLPAGSAAIVPIPTYSMYGVFTTHRAARIVPVARLSAEHGFGLDVPAMIAALPEVSVVWLCNPNNPTGAADATDDVRAILAAAGELPKPPLVVVDEAYHEFSRTSVVGWRQEFPNLLTIRTMSKAFALAGIRVGYGAAHRSVIEKLERVRPPGSISTVSSHIATAALRSPDYAAANVEALTIEREWLATELAARGWHSTPSICNFLLVRIGDNAAAEAAAEALLRSGIVPRTFGPANPLRGHLRITVRSRPENERLLTAVERLSA
ncbi:MAG TPA: histidinol-phosphate transaminase [Candidatus Limnocylindrales bacterium]|nr:histidinol-phosphate transaminase [Candidatus Limnocylindrales bacterium]